MGVTAVVGAAVIGASTTVYAANQAKKSAEDAQHNADEIANKAEADRNRIAEPGQIATAAQVQMSEQRAASAGGTIVGDPAANAVVGDGAGQPRKTLLGS